MTSSLSATLEEMDPEADHKDPNIIRKSSYTALRLYNEVPSQIDQETRIIFVGPVPMEWLVANKKTYGSWGKMKSLFPKVYSRLWTDQGSQAAANDDVRKITNAAVAAAANRMAAEQQNGNPVEGVATSSGSIPNTGGPLVAGPEGVIRAIDDLVIAPRISVDSTDPMTSFDAVSDDDAWISTDDRPDLVPNHSSDLVPQRYVAADDLVSLNLDSSSIAEHVLENEDPEPEEEPGENEESSYPHADRTDDLMLSRYLTTEGATSTLRTLPAASDEYPYNSGSQNSSQQSLSRGSHFYSNTRSSRNENVSHDGDSPLASYGNGPTGIISDDDSRMSPSPRSTSHLLGDTSRPPSQLDLSSSHSKTFQPALVYKTTPHTNSASEPTPLFTATDSSVSTMGSMQSYFTARESVVSTGRSDSESSRNNSYFPPQDDYIASNAADSVQSNGSTDDSSTSTVKPNKPHEHSLSGTVPLAAETSTATAVNQIVSPSAKSYLADILERDVAALKKKQTSEENKNAQQKQAKKATSVRAPTSKLSNTIQKAKKKPANAGRRVKQKYQKHKHSFMVSTDKLLKRKRVGEVVMIEKLLVLVKAAPEDRRIPSDFNEMEQIDTRLVQRWREYVVVARKSDSSESPIDLQFYKSRQISKIETHDQQHKRKSDKPDFSVGVGSHCEVNLYSSLDKSIVLWNRTSLGVEPSKKKDSMIYILRARSDASALNWLSFLASIVGICAESLITVKVPDLGVTIDVEIPFQDIETIRRFEDRSQLVSLKHMMKHSSHPSWMGTYIVEKCLDAMYQVEPIRKQLDQNWRGIVKAGLVWRRYDRLEWMFDLRGAQMQSSWAMMKTHHELELRPKVPFSLPIMIQGNPTPLAEPFPIEGFVTRLTTWRGEVRKQKLLNRSYFHTHDNLLFYALPIRALPPYVGSDTKDIPLICEIAPYKTDSHGRIEWLNHIKNVEEFDQYDLIAQFEMKRRIASISRSDGFVDLIELRDIRPEDDDKVVLVFKSGTILRFQVHDLETRNMWLKQLHDLMIYWKYRRRERMIRTNAIRQQNLDILHIDEDAEAFVGEAAAKWETDRGVADPLTYNIAGIACSRSLYMNGILFQKPTKFSTFRKYYVVLTLTDLILYLPSPSSVHWTEGGYCLTERLKSTYTRVNNYRVQSVSLSECYVYSGPVTSSDLLNRENTFDKENPGRHALPRAYADGWKSAEEESLRCFVLWFGKKSYAPTSRKDKKLSFKTVNRLGAGGTSMVFMARSRHDRDLWVTALNTVMSRLAVDSHEDIVVT
ncbi:Spo71p [Sugiyamaella lignohabitans]|uniref:Spo71p n=1 Tax=Sugiyamaella lignohabitans TaxID=796027 RepID=A0A167EWA4_9ASCO|nr:Spo71p [Sugiyamaella lignohabitans]ANB14536.1 Spo71p [Sugiyamaella lignohabitans]